jgi:hypothetical protein
MNETRMFSLSRCNIFKLWVRVLNKSTRSIANCFNQSIALKMSVRGGPRHHPRCLIIIHASPTSTPLASFHPKYHHMFIN